MARRRVSSGPVLLEWDTTQVHQFMSDPDGELGRTLMRRLGEIVAAGARRRVLRRTGRMAEGIGSEVGTDEQGHVCAYVTSSAVSPTGFPYPIVHEGRKVRDRRAHRSLRPALRDVRKIEYEGR